MKKVLTLFLGVIILTGTLVLSNLNPQAAKADSSNIVGNVQINLVAAYPLNSINKDTLKTIKKIAKEDSNITLKQDSGNLIITQAIDKDDDLYVKTNNGEQAKVNNGKFSINITKNSNTKLTLIKSDGQEITTFSNINTDQRATIVKNINFSDYIGDMDESNQDMSNMEMHPNIMDPGQGGGGAYPGQTYSGEPVKTGTHVHCNRFNGPNSDHKYWSKFDPRAWKDFYHSDCDYHALKYSCSDFSSMSKCDGLNVKGKGVHDCSAWSGGAPHYNWPKTAWYRN